MNHLDLPGAARLPVLGLGTWRMGESASARLREIAAVRRAIELGYRLFDTAEMYGDGGAESILGSALREAFAAGDVRREELFVVSKVYPHNASRRGTAAACDRSRARLGLDRIDLYLLHWPGSHPLAHTVAAFEALESAGHIGSWGVSNFDVDGMQELVAAGGERCAANQVWYSARQRGAEFDLRPWLSARGIALMAYSPIDQAALARDGALAAIGARIGASAAQVALAFTIGRGGVAAIPKAIDPAHQADNLAAASLTLDEQAWRAIDAAFPPPKRPVPLAIC